MSLRIIRPLTLLFLVDSLFFLAGCTDRESTTESKSANKSESLIKKNGKYKDETDQDGSGTKKSPKDSDSSSGKSDSDDSAKSDKSKNPDSANSISNLKSGDGIGTVPKIEVPNTGLTVAQCNDKGEIWKPVAVSAFSIRGECGEDLAPIDCSLANIKAHFEATGTIELYNQFIASNPDYVLYNCGINPPYLQAHFIKTSGPILNYAGLMGELE